MEVRISESKFGKTWTVVKTVLGIVIPLALVAWMFWPKKEPPERRQVRAICSGVVAPCYAAARAWGNISGVVLADVTKDGKVEKAAYKGTAPRAVRQCLLRTTRARVIDDYHDKPLRISCQYSGSITSGTRMLSSSWNLERR